MKSLGKHRQLSPQNKLITPRFVISYFIKHPKINAGMDVKSAPKFYLPQKTLLKEF